MGNSPAKEQKKLGCEVIMLGKRNVGKTNILRRLADDGFNCDYIASHAYGNKTIPSAKKTFIDDYKKISITCWEIAGKNLHDELKTKLYRNVEGVFLVFDLSSLESFLVVEYLMQEVKKYCPSGIPIFLIGNKSDLALKIEVKGRHIEKFLKEYKKVCFGYDSISAFKNVDIDKPFQRMAEFLTLQYPERTECNAERILKECVWPRFIFSTPLSYSYMGTIDDYFVIKKPIKPPEPPEESKNYKETML